MPFFLPVIMASSIVTIGQLKLTHKSSRARVIGSQSYTGCVCRVTVKIPKMKTASTKTSKTLAINSSSGSLLYSFDITSQSCTQVFYPRYKDGMFSVIITTQEGEEFELLCRSCLVDEIKQIVRMVLKPLNMFGEDYGKRGGKENSTNANNVTTTPKDKIKKKRMNKTTPPPSSLQPTHSPLTEQQARTLRVAMSGQSLFITGPAGTGKSHLLRAIATSLARKVRGTRRGRNQQVRNRCHFISD